LLELALALRGAKFHDDMALVDGDGRLIGLIPVDTLAGLQSSLVNEQLTELQRQSSILQERILAALRSNHELRQTQGLYRGLFESDALGVALLDLHGNVQAHNRRLAMLLGLSAQPVEIFSLCNWIAPSERRLFTELLAAHERQNRGPATMEFHLELPGRGTRLFRFRTGWINETSQVCACVDDITKQRPLEQQMQR
jgi:PAS domain S-box-containing protein